MPRSSYIQRLLYSTYPDYHISNAYCILHAPTIISPTPTVSCMPRPSYLQCILHSTCLDHHISNAYCILHAQTIISPMHTAFYVPRPSYRQRLLYSTCPHHHISNAYCILHAPTIISPVHTAFYMTQSPYLQCVSSSICPDISTPFSTHRNDSHFAPSALSSYFLLPRYKHSCQQIFADFSLCTISDSQTPHARLESHLTAGLCSVSILADKTSQHNMQT